MFCKNCGNQMNDNQAICLNCGCKKGTGRKYCANCGEELRQNAFACMKCGVLANFGSEDDKAEIIKKEKNEQTIKLAIALIMIVVGTIILIITSL